MLTDCVFCKIIKGELPSETLYKDENFIIIKDINPNAKIHLLAVLTAHYPRIDMQTEKGAEILGKIILKISQIAPTLGLENGYRLVINQGADSGQEIEHIHIHILGGEMLGEVNVKPGK